MNREGADTKNLCTCSQRVRITALVFTLAMLIAPGLRAGEIHDAAAAGDLNKVRAILEADPTLLESKDGGGSTPLLSACAAQRVEVANYLLDKGADVNVRDRFRQTPLHRACYSYLQGQDLALIQRLIDKGADVNAQGYNGLIPLHQAAQSGRLEVARLLIDRGADVNAFDRYNGPVGAAGITGTVLQVAINYHPKEEMAKFLVERGAKLNRKDSGGDTELHLAALKGYAELARALIEHGADVHAVNQANRTALYCAARHGFRRTAEALIAAGARESTIVEANYGKAPQLTAPLREGEVWLWTLGGGGYAVKTKGHLIVFNPGAIDESPEAGLANGRLNPSELAGLRVTGLIASPDRWWQYTPAAFELAKRISAVSSVVYPQPAANGTGNRDIPSYRRVVPHESLSVDGIQVHTIPALGGGMGYLVEADGVKILFGGLHVSSNEGSLLARYRREIDYLKPFGPVDVAMLSVSAHTNDIRNAYEPHLYLLDQLSPKTVYLMGANIPEQYSQCAAVLQVRGIPVVYPETRRAEGERFHYCRDQAAVGKLAEDLPAAVVPLNYLGQSLPGAVPQVFARGLVSTDHLEHSAPAFSPDGNIVYVEKTDRYGDIYISRRMSDGSWADPVNLGEPVNTDQQERFQMVSPDGKYLFFTRPTPGHDQDVYWVDAATIPALRPMTNPLQENPK